MKWVDDIFNYKTGHSFSGHVFYEPLAKTKTYIRIKIYDDVTEKTKTYTIQSLKKISAVGLNISDDCIEVRVWNKVHRRLAECIDIVDRQNLVYMTWLKHSNYCIVRKVLQNNYDLETSIVPNGVGTVLHFVLGMIKSDGFELTGNTFAMYFKETEYDNSYVKLTFEIEDMKKFRALVSKIKMGVARC